MNNDRIDQILGIIDAGLKGDHSESCMRCSKHLTRLGHFCDECRDVINMDAPERPIASRSDLSSVGPRRKAAAYLASKISIAVHRKSSGLLELRREVYGGQPYMQILYAGNGKHHAVSAVADEFGYPATCVLHGEPVEAYGLDFHSARRRGGVLTYNYGIL